MNAFEAHILGDWSECVGLLALRDLPECERRLDALIAVMERCQDRTWLLPSC
jgi:hypothetical protein